MSVSANMCKLSKMSTGLSAAFTPQAELNTPAVDEASTVPWSNITAFTFTLPINAAQISLQTAFLLRLTFCCL